MALTTPAADLSSQEESGVTVKEEKEDEEIHIKTKADEAIGFVTNQEIPELLLPSSTVIVNDQQKSSTSSNSTVQISSKSSEESKSLKTAPPAIDFASSCGAFGWTTIGSVHLPFIMRGEDRFIAVRMVECKIISSYADILPWTVFTCTNIKSYYITENEAKLLNEINGFHCEFQFGYQNFTPKDVVVRLKDTIKFYEFLETCKGKLNIPGANPIFNDQCGYFIINYSPVPFVKKGNTKYIPLNMVYPEGMIPPMENLQEVSEWDLAYLRFLCSVIHVDPRKLSYDVQLCSAGDLQNVLGSVPFEEWWPNMLLSSKTENSHSSSSNILPKWGDSVPGIHSAPIPVENARKLRDKINDIQDKESVLNQLFGLNKFLDMNTPISKPAHVSRNHHEQQNLMNSISSLQNGDKAIFPGTLENFLATSSCNYPYPINYRHQYSNHMQASSISEYDRCRKSDTNLQSISSNRSRSYPPPPPLVRVGGPRSVPGEPNVVPKSTSSIYPYLSSSNSQYNPWLARILEPEWLQEDNRAVLSTSEGPENLSRRLNDPETWCSTSSLNMSGAGSSNVQNSSVIREPYDQNHVTHSHGGSPRLVPGPGPPPHYPTPPQSSPLQPLSLVDCVNLPSITDIYATRSTPNGLLDLCSPPPSPDTRTALSSSPRGSHLSSYNYQPHVTRLVQVDSRYVVAINVEPHKYNSLLAVPISDVVNKFLRGTSVQSCQIVLETVFGLHLCECTRYVQEYSFIFIITHIQYVN